MDQMIIGALIAIVGFLIGITVGHQLGRGG